MLFRKDMEPRCEYCERGTRVNDREVVCRKKGIVDIEYHCRAFRYDPLMRCPPPPIKINVSRLSEDDFKL